VRLTVIERLLGMLLALFSLTLLPPILISLIYHDGELLHFAGSLVIMLVSGLLMWFPVRSAGSDLRNREVFIIVPLFWLVLGMFAGLPFILGPHLSFTDSVFESISAFTTTGATVMLGLDTLPKSILFYRQELQWLGGMGIVVLAIAILPMLRVGGMQLYRAETPGPMKFEKLTPRISQGARLLWVIYVGLTFACALAFWVAGMTPFDAVAHSLSTISTGGFSTHDQSIGYYNSVGIEALAEIFMVIGAVNFGVHFAAMRGKSLLHYWRDPEVRTFLGFITVLVIVITLTHISYNQQLSAAHALRMSVFQTVSVITSTGFTTEDFSIWPVFLPLLLIYSSFIGGCAGSTAGGMKVMRVLIMMKNSWRDVRQTLSPSSIQVSRIANRVLPDRVSDSVWAFFTVYVLVFISLLLLVMGTGVDAVTSFSAVATCLNNLGPGLGDVSSNFALINPTAKWFLAITMLLGRLEIFAVLLMFTPEFWRR
jgi:trk system potassium uptake protein TrkH